MYACVCVWGGGGGGHNGNARQRQLWGYIWKQFVEGGGGGRGV